MNADQLKREGIANISTRNEEWKRLAMKSFSRYSKLQKQKVCYKFRIEEFREWAVSRDLPMPSHHNMWGAFTLMLAAEGWIKRTGSLSRSYSARTHCHPVRVWKLA